MVIKINIIIVIIIVLKFIDLFLTFAALETGRIIEGNPIHKDLIYNRPLSVFLVCCYGIFLFFTDFLFRKKWKDDIKSLNLCLFAVIGIQILVFINNYMVFYRVI